MTRFKNLIIPAAAAGLLLCAAAAPVQAQSYTRTITTTTTTYGPYSDVVVERGIIGMGAAESVALRAEPGRVDSSKLIENSKGDMVYVFDIRNGDMTHIIRVNAFTGRVVGRDIIDRRTTFMDRLFAPMNQD